MAASNQYELRPLSQIRATRRRFLTRSPVIAAGAVAGGATAIGLGVAAVKSDLASSAINALANMGQEGEAGRHSFYGKPVFFDSEKKALVMADKGTLTAITFRNDTNLRFRHKAQVGGTNNPVSEPNLGKVKAQYGYMVAGGGNHEGEDGDFPLLDKNGNQIGKAGKWFAMTDINGLAYVAPDGLPIAHGENPYFISDIAVLQTNENLDLHRSLNRTLFVDRNMGTPENPLTFEEFAKQYGFTVEMRFPTYNPVKAEVVGKDELNTRSFPFLDDQVKDAHGQHIVLKDEALKRLDKDGKSNVYEFTHEVVLTKPPSGLDKGSRQIWEARQQDGKWRFNAMSIDGIRSLNVVNDLNSPSAKPEPLSSSTPQKPTALPLGK